MNNSAEATSIPSLEEACNEPTQRDFILQTAFLIFIMLLTFFGNFMVCLIVYLNRRLRSVTNYFIVSLAVSDLLISLLSLPFRIRQTLQNGVWCLGHEICLTWIITDLICSCASICNLAAISVDRYIAIVHPFRYHTLMTTTVAWVIIGIVWTYSITWAALSSFNWTEKGAPHFFTVGVCKKTDKIFYTVVTAMDFFLPLLIVLVMYGLVFRVAMNQARAVASLQPQTASSKADGRSRRFSINIVREVKAAKTLAIVIGAFIICWFPFFTFLMVSLWNIRLLQPPQLSEQAIKGLRGTFLYVLPAINSTLNPIIYALFNRDFRAAFIRLFQRTCGCQCTSNSANNNDSFQHSMATVTTNGSPKSPKSPKNKKNGHVKKTKFAEVYGERDFASSNEPKQV